MQKRRLVIIAFLMSLVCSCGPDIYPDFPPDTPDPQPEKGRYSAKDGVAYLYDGAALPCIHVSISAGEWNRLLSSYDKNQGTKEQVTCDVVYDKDGEISRISQASIRLRGNTSRRRPEGIAGQKHVADCTDWHHCHFQINFHKYIKDEDHEVHGARKVILKWFKDDPCYVRELYCYDLFHRDGVWTAPNAAYCRLYLQVEGDSNETYFGVYEMVEPVDERYLKVRREGFESTDGFLWKCRWDSGLNNSEADIGADLDDGTEHTYELKTHQEEIKTAKEQLQDFILKLNGKGDESFYRWIQQVCDVRLLLKTYAVNVTVGMWDDYWNNCNNYYLYFTTHDRYDYKVYMIPFDYDNTLGSTLSIGNQSDAGRQDPFNWGNNTNLFIYRLLKNPEFREIYKEELLKLVGEDEGLFCYSASLGRIRKWQEGIGPYVSNDTGEDMVIEDKPAPWGNHGEYRLLDPGENNFFKVRSAAILNYCK